MLNKPQTAAAGERVVKRHVFNPSQTLLTSVVVTHRSFLLEGDSFFNVPLIVQKNRCRCSSSL